MECKSEMPLPLVLHFASRAFALALPAFREPLVVSCRIGPVGPRWGRRGDGVRVSSPLQLRLGARSALFALPRSIISG
jgi:hypothetical protein